MVRPPNILLLVWDGFRADAVENAPMFQRLAGENLLFTNVFSPSTWSHPAHASLFTGKLPSSHEICTTNDVYNRLPLTEKLQAEDYHTSCVTANSYASRSFGLDQGFNDYVFTFTLDDPDGLVISEAISEYLRHNPSANDLKKIAYLANRSLQHENPAVSLENLSRVFLRKFVNKDFIPKTIQNSFKTNATYAYRPEWNTIPIKQRIDQHKKESDQYHPLFLFSNYMTPHHPYLPEIEQQREVGNDEIYSTSRLKKCNKEFGHPLAFIEKIHHGNDIQEAIKVLRDGYRGDVYAVDSELNNLITYMERQNMREDTIIIVTSDHGEMLGETDLLGNQRVGHLDSISDHLFTIPLLIAHPSLPAKTIKQPALLQNLMKVITQFGKDESVSEKWIVEAMVSSDPVVIERPPRSQSERIAEFDVPQEVTERLGDHLAIIRHNSWTVMQRSNGKTKTWFEREKTDIGDAPEKLLEIAKHQCTKIGQVIDDKSNQQNHRLSKETKIRLNNLGYR